MENIYQPYLMTIESVVQETPDIKTFRLVFQDATVRDTFQFESGQFGLYSVFGQGEATFCIASSPTHSGYIECSLKRVGKVTNAFHELGVNDTVGFRGPYGNSFPLADMKGKDLVFVGGGIGLAPLRSLIWNCIDTRDQYGDITIIYGARTTADLVYKQELKEWSAMKGLHTVLTVDPGGQDQAWKGEVGFVPAVLEKANPSPKNAMVITCGPPIMIKFVLQSLNKMGFGLDQVITTLEMKMKCGLGKCGRCNIGPYYVCKHGPVFTAAQLKELPNEY
jgi:sulfhydrogenase subunit gamma (sulfur reductase)